MQRDEGKRVVVVVVTGADSRPPRWSEAMRRGPGRPDPGVSVTSAQTRRRWTL
ncbi:hypothetical protein EYF80_053076 [Liparis tanakae]|uniref:Uncharacterized protein n=1 Tax=Liparis tanakae TaxID=230148 RepID=A0A4Z2F7H6_9TELE|nr:hypothetical protein EYF80_053076 [Liparis tanakae]